MRLDALRELLVSWPLYQAAKLEGEDRRDTVRHLMEFAERLDFYCPACRKESTFVPVVVKQNAEAMKQLRLSAAAFPSRGSAVSTTNYRAFLDQPFEIHLSCARLHHQARFYFDSRGDDLVKVGQSPSLVDFAMGELKRYDDVASQDELKEFRRGVELSAHGFSVAAFVHFRRVLEVLIRQAHATEMAVRGGQPWSEFDVASMEDRIKLLAAHLPEILVEQRKVYGHLSVGIHQLTEEQCAADVPRLRFAIEVILDERVASAERTRRLAEAKMLFQDGRQRG